MISVLFQIYLSLVPIIVGVAIATITELSFDMLGLWSALTSIAVYSVLQLFSKKVSDYGAMLH